MSTQPLGGTRYCGIIGYPLGHSISPAFQQAAFDRLALKVRYERWPTPTEALDQRVGSLRGKDMMGANVTVPHKERVLSLVDEVDGFAKEIGAVNTIVNRDGRLWGYNTDAPGFLRALREDAAFEPKGKGVLVLGAGGAARAVVFALSEAGADRVLISNRTDARAQALTEAARSQRTGPAIATLRWGMGSVEADLVVNTTTIGMRGGPAEGQSPLSARLLPKGALVCDLVYNPAFTAFLAEARTAGARTLGGLPMLVYQGAIAFELWTGIRAPVEVMFQAAREAMAS